VKKESKSPANKDKRKVKLRFIKLTINYVILPVGEEYRGCSGQDYQNRPSVVEFRVYRK